MYDLHDTIAAIASAPGSAARGIVRLSGDHVTDCLRRLVDTTPLNSSTRAHQFDSAWRLRDDRAVLPCRVYYWPTSRSYTRQPMAELHLLGAPALLERVLEQTCEGGARIAKPGEFTLRAFLAGRLDLAQAEAVLGVIDARDQTHLKIALRQLAGGLSGPFESIRNQLLNLCADVEAGLDFVDEDISFIDDGEILNVIDRAIDELNLLQQQMQSRGVTSTRPMVLLRGQPNVGKSTLWNRFTGSDEALVSQVPGTTRDYLEAAVEFDGLDCHLVDTAGIDAELSSGIDAKSQELASGLVSAANAIVFCLDASRNLSPWEINAWRESDDRTVWILNKCDLEASVEQTLASLSDDAPVVTKSDRLLIHSSQEAGPNGDAEPREILRVSALRGTGLRMLEHSIARLLSAQLEEEVGMVAATVTRCRTCVQRALNALTSAHTITSAGAGHELLAMEIRGALDALGEITGTIYTDDILDRVFQRFCIGK